MSPSSPIRVLGCNKEPKNALLSRFSITGLTGTKAVPASTKKAETYDGTTYTRHTTGTALQHTLAPNATHTPYREQLTRNAIYKRAYEKTRYA